MNKAVSAPARAPATSASLQGADIAWAALFCLIWAAGFSASKIALADCPPFLLVSIRYSMAGIALLAIAAASGHWQRLTRRDFFWLVVIGLILHALHLSLSWQGLSRVSSGFATIIFSTGPILVAFLSALVLGERLTITKMIGLVLGIAGVAIVFRSRLGNGHEDLVGTLFLIAGVSSLVAGTVLYKRIAPHGGIWMGLAVQFLATGICVLPIAALSENFGDLRITQPFVLSLLFIVFVNTIGSYSLWLYLLSRTSASAASSLLFLTPPLGLLLGWLLLDEPIEMSDLVGVIPIAIGIRLATRS